MKIYKRDILENIDEQYLRDIINGEYCQGNVILKLGLHPNGSGYRIFNELIKKFNISISHFDSRKKQKKYIQEERTCPICSKKFITSINRKGEKTTCSRSCANTYFRSGINNGQKLAKVNRINAGIQSETYSEICWKFHIHECIICKEKLIVAAHHYNDNHNDNRPENFVPLCPTHHQYWHSKYRYLIKEKVDEYIKNFKII